MIISKVVVGFVTQRFDTETRRFIDQEFHASDDVTWENEQGETLDYVHDGELIYGKGGVDEP